MLGYSCLISSSRVKFALGDAEGGRVVTVVTGAEKTLALLFKRRKAVKRKKSAKNVGFMVFYFVGIFC